MQNLIFLSRVTFICNICFVLAWFMKYYPLLQQGQISSTIIVLGVVVAVILNGILAVSLLIARLRHKSTWDQFPRWLIIVNLLFLILQLILVFK